jgi:hypothetical protein
MKNREIVKLRERIRLLELENARLKEERDFATVHAPMIVAFGEGVGLGRAGGSDGNEPQSVSS